MRWTKSVALTHIYHLQGRYFIPAISFCGCNGSSKTVIQFLFGLGKTLYKMQTYRDNFQRHMPESWQSFCILAHVCSVLKAATGQLNEPRLETVSVWASPWKGTDRSIWVQGCTSVSLGVDCVVFITTDSFATP